MFFVFVHFLDGRVGSGLASPVVWVVVAGGLAFGKDDCPGGVSAGRVAVAAGGDVVCALAVCVCNEAALDSSKAASAVELDFTSLSLRSDRSK